MSSPNEVPNPLTVVGRFLGVALGVASMALLVTALSGGGVNAELVAFIGILWVIWGVFSGLFGMAWDAVSGVFGRAVDGTFLTAADPAPGITIDEETAFLERRLAGPIDRHHEILTAIRLAEIYRTHQRDDAKADALLSRVAARYPDAPELKIAGTLKPRA